MMNIPTEEIKMLKSKQDGYTRVLKSYIQGCLIIKVEN